MVDLIRKKQEGKELTRAEIGQLIRGFVSGEIPDYQVSAFLMAAYFQGFSNSETAILTDEMMRSGELIDLSSIDGVKVDKHSTGGVGDKTTLVLAPLVAAAGVPVAKMSGRGMGHTGGTLDKMESIPGLSVDMSREDFIRQVQTLGIAVCGQSASLVPADKKLYALRDVTSTVENISLIASSIMSKKLACGAEAIVVDIKVGNGAYMKTEEQAEQLAHMMIGIGAEMGRKIICVVTAMDQPLGFAIGNALEVKEAIATLQGRGPADLTELCLELGSRMLILGQVSSNLESAKTVLNELIRNGNAFAKLKELVSAQGGNPRVLDEVNLLPSARHEVIFHCPADGFVSKLDARQVGLASMQLGAGRETKESQIDFGAGILLKKKVGDPVKKGDSLAILYTNDEVTLEKGRELLSQSYRFSHQAPISKALIRKVIL